MAQLPFVPVQNKGLSYINGLQMTWTDADTVTIAQGQARNSTNVNDILLQRPPLNNGTAVLTPFTISTAITGAGGIDQGTVANATLYAVYVIASSANSWINLPPSELESLAVPPFTTPSPTSPVVQDANYIQANVLFSTSFTNPLLPYGFDMFRRIGTVLTDGSANFVAFDQFGSGSDRTMTYRASVASGVTAGSSATFASVDISASVPATATEGVFKVHFTPTAADDELALRAGLSAVDEGQAVASGSVAAVVTAAMLYCPLSLPMTDGVDYKVTGSAVAINVQGYVDAL